MERSLPAFETLRRSISRPQRDLRTWHLGRPAIFTQFAEEFVGSGDFVRQRPRRSGQLITDIQRPRPTGSARVEGGFRIAVRCTVN